MQRKVENINIKPTNDAAKAIVKSFFEEYDKRLQALREAVLAKPFHPILIDMEANEAHIRHWHELLRSDQPDYSRIRMAFGYVLEVLAAKLWSQEMNGQYEVIYQHKASGTRPDFVLVVKSTREQLAWLDMTSTGAVGHIFKNGPSWADEGVCQCSYAEITYNSLLDVEVESMCQAAKAPAANAPAANAPAAGQPAMDMFAGIDVASAGERYWKLAEHEALVKRAFTEVLRKQFKSEFSNAKTVSTHAEFPAFKAQRPRRKVAEKDRRKGQEKAQLQERLKVVAVLQIMFQKFPAEQLQIVASSIVTSFGLAPADYYLSGGDGAAGRRWVMIYAPQKVGEAIEKLQVARSEAADRGEAADVDMVRSEASEAADVDMD